MNQGKIFEEDIKKSIPEDVYYLRLHDSAIGFDIENSTQRFSLKSPYDSILYRNGKMYALELKSTNAGRISFAGSNPMIKEHQIKELTKAAQYGIEAGFLINFRENGTYYVPVHSFLAFRSDTDKKSMNEKDVEIMGVLIPCIKLKVRYRYDLNVFMKEVEECRKEIT